VPKAPVCAKNAIRCMSGDHRGAATAGPPMDVSATGSDPSLPDIQISAAPERTDTNAIFVPSGEKLGSASAFVDTRNGLEAFKAW
jgi:hypothetical protein